MVTKFTPGQRVTVMLSRKHTLDGELYPHPAKFVRVHLGGDWLDVELDEAHSHHKSTPVTILSVPADVVKEAP